MIRVLQEVSAEDADFTTVGTTKAATLTTKRGSVLVVIATFGSGSGAGVFSCADDQGGVYGTFLQDNNDATFLQHMAIFVGTKGTAAAATTVTVTNTISNNTKGIWVLEIGEGATGAYTVQSNGQNQATPTTGTDATTSLAVNTAGVGLLVGICQHNDATTTAAAAGTGFTSTKTAWGFGVANSGRSEYVRTTNVASKAATYTASANNRHMTFAVFIPEAPSTAPTGSAFLVVGPGSKQQGPRRVQRGMWLPTQAPAALTLASFFSDELPERTLPPAVRQPVDPPWSARPLNQLGSLPGDDLPHAVLPPPVRSPPPWDLPPLVTARAALPDEAPTRPATRAPTRSPAESWVPETPSALPQDPPPAAPRAARAPQDLAPWLLPPVAQVSAAIPEPLLLRPRGTRPVQDVAPWAAPPLLYPFALPDPQPHRPPPSRPAQDLTAWNFQALQAISGALADPQPFRPPFFRGPQDLTPWLLRPAFSPFALPDPQPHRPPVPRPAQDLAPWLLQALQAISAALPDPAPLRPPALAAARAADPWALAPLFSPYALQDGAPARAPRAPGRPPAELWLLSPLATALALPDQAPGPRQPPRAPALFPPWDMRPLAAYTPWYQADPTTPARTRPRHEYEPWVLPALAYNQTPNSWNTVPPPPRWVNRPPQDLTPWSLPQGSTAGPWRPWDPAPARPPAPPARVPTLDYVPPLLRASFVPDASDARRAARAALRALDPAWDLTPLVRPFLPADALLGPQRVVLARAPGQPWDLRPLSPSPWHQADATRPPAPGRLVTPAAPWELAALARAALPDLPAHRPRPTGRPPVTDANVVWALTLVVLGRFLEDAYLRPRRFPRFPHEARYEPLPGSGILVPVEPRDPLPLPFTVQLLGEDGTPVNLTGLTVLCRTQPADHRRAAIVEPAVVVDLLRGLVRKTWTSEDIRRTKTGVMLLQFVTIDLAGRPRTYPGGGHYYQEDFIHRGRGVQ